MLEISVRRLSAFVVLAFAAGILAGVGGMIFLRRLREANSLDTVRGSRFKRNGDRF